VGNMNREEMSPVNVRVDLRGNFFVAGTEMRSKNPTENSQLTSPYGHTVEGKET
jgi:hypothetical protein